MSDVLGSNVHKIVMRVCRSIKDSVCVSLITCWLICAKALYYKTQHGYISGRW